MTNRTAEPIDPLSLAFPAELLRALMKSRGWSQSDLGYVLGLKDPSAVTQILSGKRGFSPAMMKLLATAFNMPPEMFSRAQAAWELRQAPDPEPGVTARARIQTEYPLREMMKRGWFTAKSTSEELETELRRFFNVKSLADVPHLAHAASRTGYDKIPAPQLAWLFRVRQIAKEMPAPNYSRERLLETLEAMRDMLGEPDETRRVPRMLHDCGVRFAVVEGLPGSKIDGVCLWLDKRSPVIGMSLRFDRIDNFWFVLRHECAHVLHGHGQDVAIIDSDLEQPAQNVSAEETIANSEAADFCVPTEAMKSFYLRKNPFFSDSDVLAFSKRMKIHPGLAVGQLQRVANRYDILRKHLVKVRHHVAGSMMMDGWGDVVPVET